MEKKTVNLTPAQQRVIGEVNLSRDSILSSKDLEILLKLPQELMRKNFLTYIETRRSLPDEIVVKIFRMYKKSGEVVIACIDKLCDFPDAAQMEIFNLPDEWKYLMLNIFAHRTCCCPRHFCDEAQLKILDLPQEKAVEILTIYLENINFLSDAAELKVCDYDQDTVKKIFLMYHHIPRDATLKKVVEVCDAATAKEIFLASIAQIDQYRNISDEAMAMVFKFPEAYRDEVLIKRFKRGYISGELLHKVCSLPDPIRKKLLLSNLWNSETLDWFFKLPEPTRSEILLHNIIKTGFSRWSPKQLAKICGFEEPYRSKLLKAYGECFGFFFKGAEKLIAALPEPLQSKMWQYYFEAIGSDNLSEEEFKRLLALKEPLRTKALSVYFAGSEAETKYLSKVFKLPEPSKSIILLAAIKAKKNMYLFNAFNISSSPYKKQLFELSEPYKTEVITAFVENGWELDEPWMLWLLPKATREPLIKVYAKKHERFDPSYYEKKIKEMGISLG